MQMGWYVKLNDKGYRTLIIWKCHEGYISWFHTQLAIIYQARCSNPLMQNMWIYGDVTSGRHPHNGAIWGDGDRKWRHHKSKMATGSDDSTNPRWRPELASPQIQDRDRKWRHHKSKMAAGSDVTIPRWRPATATSSHQITELCFGQNVCMTSVWPYPVPISFQWIFFKFCTDV